MKTGDLYKHYKGEEYCFDCIALPLDLKRNVKKVNTARYHEDTHDIDLYIDNNGTTFIDSELPHVIYQAEKHYDTNFVYAREVNNFFGAVAINSDGMVKRFRLKLN